MKRYAALFALLLVWTACLPTASELSLKHKSAVAAAGNGGAEISLAASSAEDSASFDGTSLTEAENEPSEEAELTEEELPVLETEDSAEAKEMALAVERLGFEGKRYTVYDPKQNRAFLLREEEYLVLALAAAFPDGGPAEAMKAQAIALRSVFLHRINKEASPCHEGNALCTNESHCAALYVPQDLSPYVKAVKETAGKYLSYNGEAALALSHHSSCSYTASQSHSGGEATPYLSSVPVLDESGFEGYKTVRRFTADEFKSCFSRYDAVFDDDHGNWIEGIRFDSTNRLKTVEVGGLTFSASTFCTLLGLESCCPVIITTAEGFAITCYGKGSGLGMSRCSAVLMAENGKSYGEILRYFYPGTVVSFFYRD